MSNCKYCTREFLNPVKPLMFREYGKCDFLSFYISYPFLELNLKLADDILVEREKIKFCPMCGKELE